MHECNEMQLLETKEKKKTQKPKKNTKKTTKFQLLKCKKNKLIKAKQGT